MTDKEHIEIQATDFAEVAYDTILEKVSKSVIFLSL